MKIGGLGKTLILVLTAAVLLLALWGPRLVEKKPVQPPTPAAAATNAPTAKGMVESSEEITLGSQVKGQIRRVLFSAGDSVRKGELLVELDDQKALAQVAQAKAALAAAESRLKEVASGFRSEEVSMALGSQERTEAVYLEAQDELARQQRLLGKNATTEVEVVRAEQRVQVAEAQLRENQANLRKFRAGSRTEEVAQARAARDRAAAELRYAEQVARDYRIVAPISGLVVERLKESGESTDVGTPLLKMVNPEKPRIRAELDETEIGKVAPGRQAEVTCDAYPGKVFEGSVTKVLPVIKKKTQKSFDPVASFDINTQEIHLALKDFSAFRNGMTVTVRFK